MFENILLKNYIEKYKKNVRKILISGTKCTAIIWEITMQASSKEYFYKC